MTPLQRWVAQVWSDVLDTTVQPDPTDSFVALGGHSLQAVRVVFRLRRELGIEFPFALLFETTDLAALCGELEIRLDAAGRVVDFAGLATATGSRAPAGE